MNILGLISQLIGIKTLRLTQSSERKNNSFVRHFVLRTVNSRFRGLVIKWEGVRHPILPNIRRSSRLSLANIHIMSIYQNHVCITIGF